MMQTATYSDRLTRQKEPVEFLRDLYCGRRERNSSYTITAFARDLGISRSLLSRIFSGSRPITFKFALQISTALSLSEPESKTFILTVLQTSSKTAKISKKVRAKLEQDFSNSGSRDLSSLYATVETERFKVMASWFHLAILTLTSMDHFKSEPSWIAKQLGISALEANQAIERLIALGLLDDRGGTIKRTGQNINVKTKRSEFAVRTFHEQMIAKGSEQLKKTSDADFHARLINGITFTCGPEHIEMIKDKIDKFEDEILALTGSGSKSSVYQMNVQFFPLTKTKEGELK